MKLLIKPIQDEWGVFQQIGLNRFALVFRGTRAECEKYLNKEGSKHKWQGKH